MSPKCLASLEELEVSDVFCENDGVGEQLVRQREERMSKQRADDRLASLGGPNARPSSVTFQVTDRCNYDCVHCYQERTDNPELSFPEIERILDELAALGVMFITYMGGEFFTRRDADDILKASRERGFVIRLKTTGHHVHERRADLLASLRPIAVDISVYGAKPHMHERITRQAGSWQRSIDAAQRLIRRDVPVKLAIPVMQDNAGDLAALKELAVELGAVYTFDPQIIGMENFDQSPVQLRMDWNTLRDFYDQPVIAERLDELFAGQPKLDQAVCRAGHVPRINPQGVVFPCGSLPIECGDLRTQSFADIWHGSHQFARVRGLTYAHISECNQCQLRQYCKRCHAMAMREQGKMAGPALEACRQAVAVRDSLRERGLLPSTHTVMPPTWDRVDRDGQHDAKQTTKNGRQIRTAALRVLHG